MSKQARAKLNVLAISYMLPPSTLPQAIQVGRLLSNSEHHVGALCGYFGTKSTQETSSHYSSFCVPFEDNNFNCLNTFGQKYLPFYSSRPDKYLPWTFKAEKALLRSKWLNNLCPDILVSFGEPMSDHLLAKKLKLELRIPWIAHFSDPWAHNPYRRFHKLSKGINKKLEASVVELSDHLIFTSEETRMNFAKVYGESLLDRSSILPHSFEPRLFHNQKKCSQSATIRYVGSFYGNRTPIPLIRAINLLIKSDPNITKLIKCDFVGPMPDRMRWLPEVALANKSVFSFQGMVNYEESLELMQDADLLTIIDAPNSINEFFPSKLADYLGSRRPILGITPQGPSQRIIEKIGGRVAHPDNIELIAKHIILFMKENFTRLSTPTIEEFVSNFHAKNVANTFDNLLEKTTKLKTHL